MRDTFVRALTEIAASDPRIFLVTGDLGFGVLADYRKRFPRQFLNAGVAEQNMTGLATGLALEGRVVFSYSIGNFNTLRCLEQVRNDVCFHRANVKIISVGGGFSYGQLGISHHATEDLAILRSIPNLAVISPCDLWEVREATFALARLPGPAYLRLDKSFAQASAAPAAAFKLGCSRLVREGTDVTLAATGGILAEAIKAADLLSSLGIGCRVLSVHSVKPLDSAAFLRSARETGGIVTIEEHTVDGGLGSAVAETLLESGVAPAFFFRIGLRSGFSHIVGSQEYLRAAYGMDAAAIAAFVSERLSIDRLAHGELPARAFGPPAGTV